MGRVLYRGGDIQVAQPTGAAIIVSTPTGMGPAAGTSIDAAGNAVLNSAALAAGSTVVAPLSFTAGTLLATPTAGALGYDGTAFYATPVASNRGVLLTEHFITLTGSQTCTSSTVAQTWFPGGGATGISLAPTTSYFFEGQLLLSNGTVTHTTATLLALSNGLTLTGIEYMAEIGSAAVNTPVAPSVTYVNQATSTVLNATSTATGAFIRLRGIIRTNAGGTLTPQFQWSANPTGSNQVLLNTWFKLDPVGSNSVVSVGNWA